MKGWVLAYEGLDPDQESLREALCTVGNGYFCTRGAASESTADGVHYPGTYLAGGYNRLTTEIAGHSVENEDLVNLPNWLPLSFRIEGGEWFDLRRVEILAFRQELDLRLGALRRSVRFRDGQGRTSLLSERRLVHMGQRHLAALEITLQAEDWSGRVEFRSGLDGRVVNANVERYRQLSNRHLEPLESRQVEADTILLKVQTVQSELRVALAARTRLFHRGEPVSVPRQLEAEEGYLAQCLSLPLAQGEEARIEKVIALYSSRDEAVSECGLEAVKEVTRASGFGELLNGHRLAWEHLWNRFDMEIEEQNGEERPLMILRLHLFHLLQSVSPHAMDLDVGVPARGWHGEAYRGHIFWDELFIFPLLNLRVPEITRTLLRYRYRRLSEARATASAAGLRGALYPWQSGSNGREESQRLHLNPRSGNWIPDNSRLQRHVNAAIAFNVWQYYQVTCDTEFLCFYGAEMILEIARFWASAATWSEQHQRYEIRGVMGPDEYHDGYPGAETPGLNNNAYTNVMAVWVLVCALEVLECLPEDHCRQLCEKLGLQKGEIDHWDDVSRKMRLVFHDEGIISQFEGYAGLEELDWETYRREHGKVMRLDRILEAENDTPNRYKCSKQADVLMLFYLFSADELRELFERLGYPFEYQTIPRNIEYYMSRTSHGSTLSQVVHSWVLSRSDREQSWELFTLALRSDIDDIQGGTTPEGIHLGAMAGTVDLIQRGYTGIETRGDTLYLNPCLPRELSRLCLHIRYRGQALELEFNPERMRITCAHCVKEPIFIGFREEHHQLVGGQSLDFALGEG
jgi:alpha,alpha-trehalase